MTTESAPRYRTTGGLTVTIRTTTEAANRMALADVLGQLQRKEPGLDVRMEVDTELIDPAPRGPSGSSL